MAHRREPSVPTSQVDPDAAMPVHEHDVTDPEESSTADYFSMALTTELDSLKGRLLHAHEQCIGKTDFMPKSSLMSRAMSMGRSVREARKSVIFVPDATARNSQDDLPTDQRSHSSSAILRSIDDEHFTLSHSFRAPQPHQSFRAPDEPATENGRPSNVYRLEARPSILSNLNNMEVAPSMSAHSCHSSVCHFISVRDNWVLSDELTQGGLGLNGEGADRNRQLDANMQRVINELRSMSCWSQPMDKTKGGSFAWHKSFFKHKADSTSEWPPSCSCSIPLNPDSKQRLAWDLATFALMMYDTIVAPLKLMVLQEGTIPPMLDVVINIFWLLDIMMSFLTATYVDSELRREFSTIARRYAKSWLFCDLVMVLPEWVLLIFDVDSSRQGFSLLRFMKAFRLLRFLRVLKMDGVLREQLKRVNSVRILSMLRLLQTVFCFLLLNHLISCFWFYIGHVTADGWLNNLGMHVEEESMDILSGYLLALHWSITQFHGTMEINPGNKPERAFAVVMLVCGVLTFSTFVSFTTDMVFQVRQAHKTHTDIKQRLRNYFLRHKVSTKLMLATKRYLEYNTSERSTGVNDMELLAPLPTLLQKSVLCEARTPTIEGHFLFAWLKSKHTTALRDACHHSFKTLDVLASHNLFCFADSCQQMFFIDSGVSRYIVHRGTSTSGRSTWVDPHSQVVRQVNRMQVGYKLGKRCWIAEPALWVKGWQNRGSLFTISDCSFLALEGADLASVMVHFPAVHMDITLYVKWVVQEMQLLEGHFSDLWRVDTECSPGLYETGSKA